MNQHTHSKPQTTGAKQRPPENKDNLDSRKNEEQDNKGEDITHNRKEVKTTTREHKNK